MGVLLVRELAYCEVPTLRKWVQMSSATDEANWGSVSSGGWNMCSAVKVDDKCIFETVHLATSHLLQTTARGQIVAVLAKVPPGTTVRDAEENLITDATMVWVVCGNCRD